MYTAENVCSVLKAYEDMEGYTDEQLMPSCLNGLNWVNERLKSGVDESNPLILTTAAALAHFFFFIVRLAESDKYQNYKVGDVTVKQEPLKLFQFEKELRKQAIADACSILKDCGFYCRGR